MADVYTTRSHNWQWIRNTLAFNWNHTANSSRNKSFPVFPRELRAMQMPVYDYEEIYTAQRPHLNFFSK